MKKPNKTTPTIICLKQVTFRSEYFWQLVRKLAETHQVSTYSSFFENPAPPRLTQHVAPAYDRSSLRARAWSWIRYCIGAARLLARIDRHTIVFGVTQPPPLAFVLAACGTLFGLRYILWIDDVYPDALVAARTLSRTHPVVRLWTLLNRWAFKSAMHVLTIADLMACKVRSYIPEGMHHKVTVVPTWVDTTWFLPTRRDTNNFAAKNRLCGHINVLYSGNIGISHNLSELLEAARMLVNDPRVLFVIIGSGHGLAEVANEAKGMPNVTILPRVQEEELPLSLACADIAIVTLAQEFSGISMPSKTGTMMAVGAAILGISETPSDLADTIKMHDCGINIPPGSAHILTATIQTFLDDPIYLQRCKENSRMAAIKYLSKEVNLPKVIDIITRDVNRSEGR